MGKNASDDIATATLSYVHVFNFTNMHAMSHRSDFVLLVTQKSIIKNQPSTWL